MEADQETGTSILEHPQAQILLDDATLSTSAVRGCQGRLTRFLQRYLPLFYRREQADNAVIVMEGLLSGLERKTCEPIAREHGVHRKPIQVFVGCGKWDDEAVMGELRRHVKEEMADANAVLVVDPSTFPKKGSESCGVKRQWCGRLGKEENCQVGVFLCYAAAKGHTPLDRRLYLPQDWAQDPDRRDKCHVPPEVVFQEKWRIGLDLLDRCRGDMPHAWTAADDEFGRCTQFRRELRARGENYVLDVPCNITVRDLEARRPPRRRKGKGRKKKVPFVQVRQWADKQPESRWQRLEVRAGEKGPLVVEAITTRVTAKGEGHRICPEERLLVIRSAQNKSDINYSLSNADGQVPLAELVRVHCERHRIEEMFEEAKGEAGLDNYEVRSWVGWHHHITLSLLALWFLVLEKGRLGKKKLPGGDRAAGQGDLLAADASSAADKRADRPTGE
jgi:SRSO17 transposase